MSLSNSLYDEIMRSYDRRQLDDERQLQQRYQEIFTKIPRIRELDDRISALGIEKAKLYLDGDEAALDQLKESLHLLSAEKNQLLTAGGYPADYLEKHYTCSDCHDTGYIGNKKCHCFEQAEIALLYSQSNLGNILKLENFDHFDLNWYSDEVIDRATGRSSRQAAEIALKACRSFAADFGAKPQNLLIFGDTGIGKSFLSHCIAKELLDRYYSVVYLTATGFYDVLAKTVFERFKDDSHIYDCDLLIIDDLGTEMSNSFTSTQLFVVLNERLLRGKSTLISTNLSLDNLKTLYSERVFSRISSNYTILRMTGEDIRIKKKTMHNAL